MTSRTKITAYVNGGLLQRHGSGATMVVDGGVLSRVDEDEIFLFDEDFNKQQQQQQQVPFRKSCSPAALVNVMHDLEYMNLEDRKQQNEDEVDDDETSKTENNFLRSRRFHHFAYGHSPDLASSCDSDYSASITIEGLRDHLQSCFTCGVLWRENQASLDCHECDGYALTRPCMDCNGSCNGIWNRDLTTSHQIHKAKWIGSCKLTLRNCSIESESTQLSDN